MSLLFYLCIFAMITSMFCYEIRNAGALLNEQKENPELDPEVIEGCTSICSSSECTSVAENLIENMDQTVDPCDDFYQFVCGNYIKQHVLVENENFVDQMNAAQERTNKKLVDILNSKILPTDIEAFKKLKILYKNCLDEDEIDNVGVEPLLNLLNRLGGWPVLLGNEWKEENYKLVDLILSISKEGFDPDFPMSLFLWFDHSNSLAINLYSTYSHTKSTEAHRSYVVDIAVLLGADPERANTDIQDMFEFERKLYKNYDSYRPSSNTIKGLSKEFSDLSWLDIINAILSPNNVTATGNESVNYDPTWVSELVPLIKNTPKRVVANYQIYQLVDRLMLFLPEKFRNRKLLSNPKLFSSRTLPRRENICLDVAKHGFEIAIASLYIRNYFDQQSKNKIDELINNIRAETKALLEKLDWMDDHTRDGALTKLGFIRILVAYPKELIDDKNVDELYDNLEIIEGKFFDNVQKSYLHARNIKFDRFKKSTQKSYWICDVPGITTPYAFYNLGQNQIRINAGILEEPFFNSQWLDYLNYGGIGHLIGHEIIDGFNARGRFYNSKDWWSDKATANFEKKVQCKIDEYNNYTVKQIDRMIDGRRTKLENVADAAGIKISYNAYKKSTKNKGVIEECLPNLKYSPEKLFWINAATTHCSKMTDEYLRKTLVWYRSSPPEARVNVVFSDNEDFAKDFKCPVGSTMNPTKKCEVW